MVIILALLLSLVILLLSAVILMGIFFVIDFFLELPFVAAKGDRIKTIMKLAQIKPGETVVDLGSGDGRLLFAAARLGGRAIGYELNPFLVLLTRFKARLLHPRGEVRVSLRSHPGGVIQTGKHLEGVIVKRQNFWTADLKSADVIFVYAFKKTMPKLEKFIYQHAKKGARVLVNTNPFPAKKPQKSENGIFLYRV